MAGYVTALWRGAYTGHGDQVELDGVHLLQGIHHATRDVILQMSHLEVMVGLMDLTSHPEISGSTNTTHGHAQRGTGSPVQPTSMWLCCVCCALGSGRA